MSLENSNLVENYAQLILDGMDNKTLEQFAYDCLVQFLHHRDDQEVENEILECYDCLLYTSPSPRDATLSRMPSSA